MANDLTGKGGRQVTLFNPEHVLTEIFFSFSFKIIRTISVAIYSLGSGDPRLVWLSPEHHPYVERMQTLQLEPASVTVTQHQAASSWPHLHWACEHRRRGCGDPSSQVMGTKKTQDSEAVEMPTESAKLLSGSDRLWILWYKCREGRRERDHFGLQVTHEKPRTAEASVRQSSSQGSEWSYEKKILRWKHNVFWTVASLAGLARGWRVKEVRGYETLMGGRAPCGVHGHYYWNNSVGCQVGARFIGMITL